MKNLSFIVLSFMILAACNSSSDELASPSVSSSQVTERGKKPRPFQANLTGVLNLESAPTACTGGPIALLDYFISGNATHLGNLNAASFLHHDNCNLDLGAMLLSADVSGDLVGANGDKITYTGEDVINVYNFLVEPGPTGSITGTWTITGGTGRFEGATGSFTISGLVDFATLGFNVAANGTITY